MRVLINDERGAWEVLCEEFPTSIFSFSFFLFLFYSVAKVVSV